MPEDAPIANAIAYGKSVWTSPGRVSVFICCVSLHECPSLQRSPRRVNTVSLSMHLMTWRTVRSASRVAALVLSVSAQTALAWGPQGHRTIGAIADRLLTPAAHEAMLQILEDDRDKFGNPS